MTRKHFNSLALGLAHVRPNDAESPDWHQWCLCVEQVALSCQEANRSFDKDRFKEACLSW